MTGYKDALEWLYGLESRGAKLGLDRVRAAAETRGDPHKELTVVHVAGTNGKGSVVTMVEAILRAAGFRTGKFISPHLQRFVERVQINGRPISEREAAQRIRSFREDPRLAKHGLTFFEHTALLAFEAFRDADCDVAVVEVGLGGRLDATNIVDPAVTVITNISLEHQRILGDTRGKIAAEKAGIIKSRTPCVVGARGTGVRRVIAARARKHRAPVRWIDKDFQGTWDGRRLDVRVGDVSLDGLRLGLKGRYQKDNAACAVAAIHELEAQGFRIGTPAVYKGVARAKWPGRLELMRGSPTFLFDAAHNAAGCGALARYLEELDWPGRKVLLFGAMKDKDHRRMLGAFDGIVDRRIYATPKMRRSESPRAFARIRDGSVARSVREGLARAVRAAGDDGLVVVAGSIFLLSEARSIVTGTRSDPPIAM